MSIETQRLSMDDEDFARLSLGVQGLSSNAFVLGDEDEIEAAVGQLKEPAPIAVPVTDEFTPVVIEESLDVAKAAESGPEAVVPTISFLDVEIPTGSIWDDSAVDSIPVPEGTLSLKDEFDLLGGFNPVVISQEALDLMPVDPAVDLVDVNLESSETFVPLAESVDIKVIEPLVAVELDLEVAPAAELVAKAELVAIDLNDNSIDSTPAEESVAESLAPVETFTDVLLNEPTTEVAFTDVELNKHSNDELLVEEFIGQETEGLVDVALDNHVEVVESALVNAPINAEPVLESAKFEALETVELVDVALDSHVEVVESEETVLVDIPIATAPVFDSADSAAQETTDLVEIELDTHVEEPVIQSAQADLVEFDAVPAFESVPLDAPTVDSKEPEFIDLDVNAENSVSAPAELTDVVLDESVLVPVEPVATDEVVNQPEVIHEEFTETQPSTDSKTDSLSILDDLEDGDITSATFPTPVTRTFSPQTELDTMQRTVHTLSTLSSTTAPETTTSTTQSTDVPALFESIALTQQENSDISLARSSNTTASEVSLDSDEGPVPPPKDDAFEFDDEEDISSAFKPNGIILEPTYYNPEAAASGEVLESVDLEEVDIAVAPAAEEVIVVEEPEQEELKRADTSDFDNERMLLMSQVMDKIDVVTELIVKIEKTRKETGGLKDQIKMMTEVIEDMMKKGVGAASSK
ncbi:hypothetical protein HDU79_003480 [Rhizoclosmatium sp. JEL0117]|nr:hypothetical protein HDU79_003480 [Rhizoclosmatium sp. JEL0117]